MKTLAVLVWILLYPPWAMLQFVDEPTFGAGDTIAVDGNLYFVQLCYFSDDGTFPPPEATTSTVPDKLLFQWGCHVDPAPRAHQALFAVVEVIPSEDPRSILFSDGWDSGSARVAWTVTDGIELFADGFESGDTRAWLELVE